MLTHTVTSFNHDKKLLTTTNPSTLSKNEQKLLVPYVKLVNKDSNDNKEKLNVKMSESRPHMGSFMNLSQFLYKKTSNGNESQNGMKRRQESKKAEGRINYENMEVSLQELIRITRTETSISLKKVENQLGDPENEQYVKKNPKNLTKGQSNRKNTSSPSKGYNLINNNDELVKNIKSKFNDVKISLDIWETGLTLCICHNERDDEPVIFNLFLIKIIDFKYM